MTNFLDVALGKAEAHLGKGEMGDAEKVSRSVLAPQLWRGRLGPKNGWVTFLRSLILMLET